MPVYPARDRRSARPGDDPNVLQSGKDRVPVVVIDHIGHTPDN